MARIQQISSWFRLRGPTGIDLDKVNAAADLEGLGERRADVRQLFDARQFSQMARVVRLAKVQALLRSSGKPLGLADAGNQP